MTDEKFVFISDSKEKKNIARSAYKKRTHCGKGGNVRFPSDNLSKKELKKMSGEVMTYRLNDPMKWAEFKEMPDDLKRDYIKLIRQKFNATGRAIAEMMGVSQFTVSHEFGRLGIQEGKGHRGKCTQWDKAGFELWAFRKAPEEPELIDQEEVEMILENHPFEIDEPAQIIEPVEQEERRNLIPYSGEMRFEGNADEVMKTVSAILGGAYVKITIEWDVRGEEKIALSI